MKPYKTNTPKCDLINRLHQFDKKAETLMENLQWEADWLQWDRLHLLEDYMC